MDTQHYYRTLGLQSDASQEQIIKAYRELVKQWHPDRAAHNPSLQIVAEEKLKEINVAYEFLKSYNPSSTASSSQGQRAQAERQAQEAESVYKREYVTENLLQIENLETAFGREGRGPVAKAVRGVSFGVKRGETLGIVGESGSGKSVTALSILRLIASPGRITGGRIFFDGADLLSLSEKQMRGVRGARIAMVFQDPMTALNPTLTVGEQIAETISAHQKVSPREARALALDWLTRVRVSLPERRMRQYPHELSGGMRQRVMIAIAFSCRPALLLADEPTTALDVTVQAQILDLMDELKAELGTAIVLITHDLGVVRERCDDVAVMYAGQIVEYASAEDLFTAPKHPYTQSLLASLPDWRRASTGLPLPSLPGQPPPLTALPPGCPFAPRCPKRFAPCPTVVPASTLLENNRTVRCLLYEEAFEERDDKPT